MEDSDSDEYYDEEDEQENAEGSYEQMAQARTGSGFGMMGQYDYADGNQVNYFTWDQLLKVIPKLPDIVVFLQKEQIRNTKFFEDNDGRYNPPFYVFSRKPQIPAKPKQLNFATCNEYEGIPHTNELLTLF